MNLLQLAALALLAVLGPIAGAWQVWFWQDEFGCVADPIASDAVYMHYTGEVATVRHLDFRTECINVGYPTSSDSNVSCGYNQDDGGCDPGGVLASTGGFGPGRSARIMAMEYCLAYPAYNCSGDYMIWRVGENSTSAACHPGIMVSSFKCLE